MMPVFDLPRKSFQSDDRNKNPASPFKTPDRFSAISTTRPALSSSSRFNTSFRNTSFHGLNGSDLSAKGSCSRLYAYDGTSSPFGSRCDSAPRLGGSMHASSMEMEATQSPMSVEENHSTSHSFACSSFRESPFVTFFGVKEDGLKEDGLDASTDEANTTGLRDEGSATREKAVMRLKMPKLPLPERSQQSSDDESSLRPKVLCFPPSGSCTLNPSHASILVHLNCCITHRPTLSSLAGSHSDSSLKLTPLQQLSLPHTQPQTWLHTHPPPPLSPSPSHSLSLPPSNIPRYLYSPHVQWASMIPSRHTTSVPPTS